MKPTLTMEQHLGFIQLNEAAEIEGFDTGLQETLGSELGEWRGLPFMQWVHHAYMHVASLSIEDTVGPVTQSFQTGRSAEDASTCFRIFKTSEGSVVQVSRSISAENTEDKVQDEAASTTDTAAPLEAQHSWSHLLAWMGPGFLHDANNQLAALASLTECLLEDLNTESVWNAENQGDLELIQQCGKQTAQLFQFLTKIYRSKPGDRNYHNLGELMEEAGKLIKIALPNSYRVTTETGQERMPVYVDRMDFLHLLVGQAATWFPDRNASIAGMIQFHATSSQPDAASYQHVAGPYKHQDLWTIEIQLEEVLQTATTETKDSPFSKHLLEPLLQKLDASLWFKAEGSRWAFGFPRAKVD